MQPRPFEEVGREAEPDGRVVAAAHDDARPGVDEAHEGLGEQLDGVGDGPVDVTADEHRVDPLVTDDLDEVVEVGRPRAPSSPTWWNARPRCQSEVWISRTAIHARRVVRHPR